jgi:hypothetical protein
MREKQRRGRAVLATDDASSESFAMPSAPIERDQVIDHVIGLDELPALLVSLVSARYVTFDAPPAGPAGPAVRSSRCTRGRGAAGHARRDPADRTA